MPTITARRRLTLVGLLLVGGAFATVVGTGLSGALVYYLTPTELLARQPTGDARLYGVVVPGSVGWDAGSETLSFRVTDGTSEVAVQTQAIPTALFRDGIGVVLLGRIAAPGGFRAEELLIKHSEVYEPLGPGETVPPPLLDLLAGDAGP